MKAMTLSAKSSTESNSPRRRRRRSKIEKNNSTWFSQLAWVGVWWMCTLGLASKNSTTLSVLWAERLSAMEGEALRGELHQVTQELDEVVAPGRVSHPSGDVALVHVEGGEEHGRAVALVLELPSGGLAGNGRFGGVDPGLGLHPRLLVHRPDHGVVRGMEVEATDVGGLLPEIGVVARHP